MKILDRYNLCLRTAALAALLLGSGCTKDEVDLVVGEKGTSQSVYLSSKAGTETVRIESDSPWKVYLSPETRTWASIENSDSGVGNGSFAVSYRTNDGFPRRGTVLVESESRRVIDTVYLMQYGVTPLLELLETQIEQSSVSTTTECRVDTNIPLPLREQVTCRVVYPEAGPTDWIRIDTLTEVLRFTVADNLDFQPRSAEIRLGFTDEWGEVYVTSCSVQQGIPGGTPETREITFEELRALISGNEGEMLIEEDIAVSGVVISDCTSPNMVALPMPAAKTRPDISASGPNYRTAYMQNADGSLGLMLETADASQNNMKRYDRIKLWCKGLTLRKAAAPECYVLSGVTLNHFVTKTAGTAADLPAKRRFIDELTDRDLYTYVTLKRSMMAVRTGRFAPVHCNYFTSYNAYYPNIVLDRHGSMIYLMTNTGCTYCYDEMPDGEGTVSGIIVHEPYTFFDKDGDIGAYQIRPVTREDIALAESDSEAFSAVAVEWAPNGSNAGTGNVREYAYPQYPYPANAEGKAHCVVASTGSGLSFMSTYAWLNWGTAYRAKADGNALANMAWGHAQMWNTSSDTGNSMLFEFSTQGLASDQCSFVFAFRYYSGQGALRYWTAEYSLDGHAWNPLGDFTVPDQGYWSNMQPEQLSGDKNVCLSVPAEILGRDVAWIRLRPVSDKIGTSTGYDSATIAANGTMSAAFVVSYAALRYNK